MFAKADPFITPPEAVSLVRIDKIDDFWFAYLVDSSAGLFARLTFGGCDDACGKLGASIISPDQIQALHDNAPACALELPPFNLPDHALADPAGVALDWEHNGVQLEAFLTSNMGGRAWAEHHEDKVQTELVRRGWDGSRGVVGVGKNWTRIDKNWPAAGRAYLMGWWDGHRWIQPRPSPGSVGPHGRDEEHDYGTTSIAVWTVDPMTIPAVVAALAIACTNPYTGQPYSPS